MKKKWMAALLSLTMAASVFTAAGAKAEAAEDVTTLRVVLKGISMEDERQRVWFDEYNKALAEAGIPAKLEVVEMQSLEIGRAHV